MQTESQNGHERLIINQFTKQAIPFKQFSKHMESVEMLIEMSNVKKNCCVLDIACGPGLVSCEFAKVAGHVTGIDITEKMIEEAKKRQSELGLDNLSWDVGSAYSLPYEAEAFDLTMTRYSFHHFLDPESVLKEMIRVCKPKGTILIADVALPSEKLAAYNQVEKLRDPSHTKALSYEDWEELLGNSGLKKIKRGQYKVRTELEKILKASFPDPGAEEQIVNIFRNDININSLGMDVHLKDKKIHFSFPISIYAAVK